MNPVVPIAHLYVETVDMSHILLIRQLWGSLSRPLQCSPRCWSRLAFFCFCLHPYKTGVWIISWQYI